MILLAAFALAAQAAAAAQCRFPVRHMKGVFAWDDETMDEQDSRCVQMTALVPDFERLRQAADRPQLELRLVDDPGTPIASYDGSVNIAQSALKMFEDPATRRGILAHEIGHALQRGPTSKAGGLTGDAYVRALEAQADAFGRDLLPKAGFSADDMKTTLGVLQTCVRYTQRPDHPVLPARLLNQDLLARRDALLSNAGRVYDKEGARSGDVQASAVVASAPKLGDFNAQGILKASHWISSDVALPGPPSPRTSSKAPQPSGPSFRDAVVAAADELLDGPGLAAIVSGATAEDLERQAIELARRKLGR